MSNQYIYIPVKIRKLQMFECCINKPVFINQISITNKHGCNILDYIKLYHIHCCCIGSMLAWAMLHAHQTSWLTHSQLTSQQHTATYCSVGWCDTAAVTANTLSIHSLTARAQPKCDLWDRNTFYCFTINNFYY